MIVDVRSNCSNAAMIPSIEWLTCYITEAIVAFTHFNDHLSNNILVSVEKEVSIYECEDYNNKHRMDVHRMMYALLVYYNSCATLYITVHMKRSTHYNNM